MKKVILISIMIMLPGLASAHPGKTDSYGGHKCLKGCETWQLYYEEYHLHDKDGNAIRVAKGKKRKKPAASTVQPVSELTATPAQEVVVSVVTVTTTRHVTNVYEENLFLSNPYLIILLILLLLLLILKMNRNKEEN